MIGYYIAIAWLAIQFPLGIKLGKWIKSGALA